MILLFLNFLSLRQMRFNVTLILTDMWWWQIESCLDEVPFYGFIGKGGGILKCFNATKMLPIENPFILLLIRPSTARNYDVDDADDISPGKV